MIVKSREMPELLGVLPRLMERLSTDHSAYEKVLHHHRSLSAGFRGEQVIDEVLERISWNTPSFLIYDLNFETGSTRCQVDHLILTPYYALVLEVKNFSGTLIFQDDSFQMTRVTRDGVEEGFDSPVIQLRRAVKEVEYLFQRHHVPLPVYKAVVLPFAKTLVKGPPGIPIVFSKSLPYFISELPTSIPPIDDAALQKAAHTLASLHLPFYPTNFQKRYGFAVQDLRAGVICRQCRRKASKKSIRSHYCQPCKISIRDGYSLALQDWRDFISPLIRSSECQDFLQLPNKNATYYVLKNLAERIEYGLWRIK